MLQRPASACACLCLALFASGCGTPPHKEMDQAQGAIDAARAAGADRYAVSEYVAATQALENANEAVVVRDYRLALSHALESLEHAQSAARVGAETQAKTRADVERSTTELTALVATAHARLASAREARVASPLLAQPEADIVLAETALQESGEAVVAGDYLAAAAAVMGVRDRLTSAIAAIDAATAAQPPRKR